MKKNGQTRLLWASFILSLFLLIGCGEGIKSVLPSGGGAGSGGGDTGGAAPAAIDMSSGSGDPEAAAALGIEAIASGGDCGYMQLESYGDLRILSEGNVDASFTVPDIESNFGEVHYTVEGDETVPLDPALPTTGIYVESYDENLYLDDGNLFTSPEIVTGLTVAAGATLRLPDTYSGDQWAYLWFDNDIVINGTVTGADESVSIDLETSGNIVIGETGVITTAASTPGEYGGDIYLYVEGMVVNQGILVTDGADGDSETQGGRAGSVYIEGYGDLYNTGTISANGGDNANGDAGNADYVYLYSYDGSLYTSGTVTAEGGSAINGSGGDGDSIYACAGCDEPNETTLLVVSGVLSNNGGDAQNGDGGNVYEYIELYNYGYGDGSNVLINVEMSSRGGNSVGGNGGSAYDIYVYVANGGARIAGTMDVSGGDGLVGGDGGWIEVYTYGAGQPLELVGFDAIAMNGGDGDSGGRGGDVYLSTYSSWDGEIQLPASGIQVDVPISVSGGSGTVYGGSGGDIYMYTGSYRDLRDENTHITNSAAHSTAGGDGGTSGGSGGDIYFYSARTQDPEMPATVDNAEGEHDVSGGTGDEENGSDGAVYYDELFDF